MPIRNDDGQNLAKAPKDKYIEDLKKYTKGQLFELRDRQKKLLANKFVFGMQSFGSMQISNFKYFQFLFTDHGYSNYQTKVNESKVSVTE